MNTLEDLQEQLDRGGVAGIRGIPADPRHWGADRVEIVFRRRGGLIEAHLHTSDGEPRDGLGPPTRWGRLLAIGPTSELIEAFAWTEELLESGPGPLRQLTSQFLAMAGGMLSGLTVVALGDCGNFHGLEWRCIEGTAHPVLRAGENRFDGLAFWMGALDGTVQGAEVEYQPRYLWDCHELAARLLHAWLTG